MNYLQPNFGDRDNSTQRLLVALVLSVVVMMAYDAYFGVTPPPVPPAPTATAGLEASPEARPPVAQATATPAERGEGDDGEAQAETPPRPDRPARRLTIETRHYAVVLSNEGGVIESLRLHDYRGAKGTDIELAPQAAPGTPGLLTILSETGEPIDLPNYEMVAEGPTTLQAPGDSTTVVLRTESPALTVEKRLTFRADTYGVDLRIDLSAPAIVALGAAPKEVRDAHEKAGGRSYNHIGPLFLTTEDRVTLTLGDIDGPARYPKSGTLKLAGWETAYFASVVLPVDRGAWTIGGRLWPRGEQDALVALELPAGEADLRYYGGPKKIEVLRSIDPRLEELIDFGMFAIFSRPLLALLKFFHRVTGNYGIAIVLLTFCVRLLFFPLAQKSYKSMKRMQEVQPRMQAIREKYSKDPQRMNQEIMQLYREEGISPLSGCLPMLPQIPVFFALYNTIYVAIELRGAPFMLWITDLSEKDPYYVLPILMGITMVVQQWMSPAQMDPRQRRMMMFMPIVFTFMFLNFSAGLTLYWLVNNLLSVIQQYVIYRGGSGEVTPVRATG